MLTEILESKSAPLYHFTTFPAVRGIIEQDCLMARSPHAGARRSISFSRVAIHPYILKPVVLTVDQEKLTRKFKIEPHYGASKIFHHDNHTRESEERVYGDIENLHSYLIKMVIGDPEDDFDEMVISEVIEYCERYGVEWSNLDSKWNHLRRKEPASTSSPSRRRQDHSANDSVSPDT